MSHNLIEIPLAEWPELRDLYKNCKISSTGYQMIDNFINWQKKNLLENIKIYALDGEWRADGTFILIFKYNVKDMRTQIFFNTLSNSHDRLSEAFHCLSTSEAYTFNGYSKRFDKVVEAYIAARGQQGKTHGDRTFWHHCSKSHVASFDVVPPEGIRLAPLELKHAEQINAIWPHRHPNSEEFIKRLLTYNEHVGAYDEAGNLVAWCLVLPLGALGLLQVENQYKRKGLGNLMVRSLAKNIVAKGFEVMAPVVCANTASLKMFEKLGFKIVDEVIWTVMEATVEK